MALLDLDDADLSILNQALMQMPYGAVAPLVAKIVGQLNPAPTQEASQDQRNHEFASDIG